MTTAPSPVVKLGLRPPRELMSSTSFLLKRLGWAIKARGFDAFEAAGESPYHHAVLAVLDEKDVETQATIADALGYDRSWLVGLLDELEEGGYIERRRDPTDRRRHLVVEPYRQADCRCLSHLTRYARRGQDRSARLLAAEQPPRLSFPHFAFFRC